MSVVQARISFSIINKDLMPFLTDCIAAPPKEGNGRGMQEKMTRVANVLIKDIGDIFPAVYRAHLTVFIEMLSNPNESIVVDALFALVNFMQQFPNELIGIKGDTLDTLVHFATEGTVKQAKYATILACHLLQEDTSTEIIEV
jgi:hypothetical protein